jgi:hypothetical protein
MSVDCGKRNSNRVALPKPINFDNAAGGICSFLFHQEKYSERNTKKMQNELLEIPLS